MDQSFDTAFQLDEGAVIHQADHLALHSRPHGIFLRHGMPRIGRQLFHAEGNALFLGIELEHHHLNFLTHLNDFRWMADATP
jgi:hypothetical protein